MQTAAADVPAPMRDAVVDVLTRRLGPHGLAAADMRLTESHDGFPMLLIEASFPGGGLTNVASLDDEIPVLADTEIELLRAARAVRPGIITHLRLRIPDVPAPGLDFRSR